MININEYLINRQTKQKSKQKPQGNKSKLVCILELPKGKIKNADIRLVSYYQWTDKYIIISYCGGEESFLLDCNYDNYKIKYPKSDWYISCEIIDKNEVYILSDEKAIELITDYLNNDSDYFVEKIELDSYVDDAKYLNNILNELKNA